MNISKEQFEKSYSDLTEKIEKSGKRSRIIINILRIFGILFIAGAVTAIFDIPTGVMICLTAAAVYTFAFYAELESEKKEQLEAAHMVYTKRTLSAINSCNKITTHTDEDESSLYDCLESETDNNRKCMLGIELFRLLCDKGEFTKAYDILNKDSSVYSGDDLYSFFYSCCMLRYYVSVKKSSESDEIIMQTYALAQKKYEELQKVSDDFLLLVYAAETEMIMSYYREDYLKCIEYGEIRLSGSAGTVFGLKADRSAESFRLMYAECLYYAGKYDLSREICDKMRSEITFSPYLKEKADELWELLN